VSGFRLHPEWTVLGYGAARPLAGADKQDKNYSDFLISCSALLECAGITGTNLV
jgi:hypothetical protein